jgi:Mg2+/Co2+ transporter CorB
MIPAPGTSLLIANYPVEITRTDHNAVQTARIHPRLVTQTETPESGMEAG